MQNFFPPKSQTLHQQQEHPVVRRKITLNDLPQNNEQIILQKYKIMNEESEGVSSFTFVSKKKGNARVVRGREADFK